jgi:beta-lactam-binding protein with PASTA domain
VKFLLGITGLVVSVVLAGGAATALAGQPTACVVPRLYTLTLAAAQARLVAAGCRLGGIAFERPRTRTPRITAQVPAPGAMLPRPSRVSLLVS